MNPPAEWVIFSLKLTDDFSFKMDLMSLAKRTVYIGLLAYFLFRLIASIQKLLVF